MSESRDKEPFQKKNNSPETREGEAASPEEAGSEGQLPDTSAAESVIEGDLARLQKQLGESEKLLSSYKDQLLRLAAEFENFRKRVEVDKADFVKFSNERIIKDLLPILDDFGRALTTGSSNHDFDAFYKGIELIYQKLSKMLEDKGLKPIESIGKEFDVAYHDVLMQIPKPDVRPHTIVEEVERGYTLHGKVIKHAKVIIAADSPGEEDSHPKD